MNSQQFFGENEDIFFKKYGLDPQYGHNIPSDYEPKCWNKKNVLECLINLHEKIKDKTIVKVIDEMKSPELNLEAELDTFTKERDFIYLHGFLSDLLHAYIAIKRS